MFIRRRHRKMEAEIPPERNQAQDDLMALHRAKRIEKDTPRHQAVKNLAKEKLATKGRRGKRQGMIERHDNTITSGKAHYGDVREKKYPQENVD